MYKFVWTLIIDNECHKFWVIPQFTFSLPKIKKYIRTKKEIQNKNNNIEKRMPERLENGLKLVEEVQKYKD